MSLFKRFTDKKKPTKEELNSFKFKLKMGDDPNEHWKAQEEHWEKYKFHRDIAMELLCKMYDVQEVSKDKCYSKLEIWHWTAFSGPCEESPIGKHLYVNHYGDKNAKKGETPVCLACNKELKL